MRTSGQCRLAVVASHPIQYFTPLYQRLARTPNIELDVFFCRDFGVRPQFDRQFDRQIRWDTDLLSGYRHTFLANVSPVRDPFSPAHAINPGVVPAMLHGYDALWINGFLYPSNWLAVAAGSTRGTALLMRSELRLSPERTARPTDRVRDAFLRWWIRRCDALLYIGRENEDAYRHFGASDSQLFFCPYSADVDLLRASRLTSSEQMEARQALGIAPGSVVVLYVGKLIPRKHPEAALALLSDPALRDRVHVLFAGSGPLESTLREQAARDGLSNISFLGFVNQQELPRIYALADLFLFPAEGEPWGLVLNEAMVTGLAPVVSRDVGAATDLVEDGVTGFLFPPGDWNRMTSIVRRLVDDEVMRGRIGAAASVRASAYSYDASVAGILEALTALGHWTRPVGTLVGGAS